VDLRTKRVFRGFLELSPNEQQEFISELYVFLWEKEESRLPVEQICEFGLMALGPFHEPGVCPGTRPRACGRAGGRDGKGSLVTTQGDRSKEPSDSEVRHNTQRRTPWI
jgi:hypothetical protein